MTFNVSKLICRPRSLAFLVPTLLCPLPPVRAPPLPLRGCPLVAVGLWGDIHPALMVVVPLVPLEVEERVGQVGGAMEATVAMVVTVTDPISLMVFSFFFWNWIKR